MNADEAAIRDVLEKWAEATRDGREEEILANHLDDLVLFDVLSPLPPNALRRPYLTPS